MRPVTSSGALRANDHWRAARAKRCADFLGKAQKIIFRAAILVFLRAARKSQKRAARKISNLKLFPAFPAQKRRALRAVHHLRAARPDRARSSLKSE